MDGSTHLEPLPGAAADPFTDVSSERDILAQAQVLGHTGAWAWDIPTGQLWWSDEMYRIFGLEPQEFPATYDAFLQHVHPEDRDAVGHSVDSTLDGADTFPIEHRVIRPDGVVRYVHSQAVIKRADDGTPLRVLGALRDMTDEHDLREERDAAVTALAESEELYRLLVENAWDVIWTMELDGSISYVSPAVERMRGITPAEAMAQTPDQIQPPDSVAKGMEYYARLFEAIANGTEPPTFHGEQEYYRKDGSIMLGELDVIPQVNADGKVIRILGVTRDISDRRAFEEELNRLAVTDPLTGIWNRRQAEALFRADLAESRRYGPALTLLMLDLDHFKDINDTFGHQSGDRALVQLTERLVANLRASDVLCRWGGEEFVILMRHCTLAEGLPLAEKLRSLVAETPFPEIGTLTVSIGVAELQPDDDLGSWLDRADRAMYAAKSAGRNAVRAES